jgi:hypothetical protein
MSVFRLAQALWLTLSLLTADLSDQVSHSGRRERERHAAHECEAYCVLLPVGASAAFGSGCGLSDLLLR